MPKGVYPRKDGLLGPANPNWKGGHGRGSVVLTCAECGQRFGVEPSRKTKAKWCSGACYHASQKGRRTGPHSPGWKGGRKVHEGRILVYEPDHHRAMASGYVFEHLLIAEAALKKPLTRPAVVHHVNERHSDNRNTNLLICQDQGYHLGVHARRRTQLAGGNPWTEKLCGACERVLPRSAFYRSSRAADGLRPGCRGCTRVRYARKRTA